VQTRCLGELFSLRDLESRKRKLKNGCIIPESEKLGRAQWPFDNDTPSHSEPHLKGSESKTSVLKSVGGNGEFKQKGKGKGTAGKDNWIKMS